MTTVLVHGGSVYPKYLTDCIHQFFLTNQNKQLFIIVDKEFEELKNLKDNLLNLTVILSSTLKKTFSHKFYLTFNRTARSTWRNGFWRYVIERFFILNDFMNTYDINNIIHFEYDNLIYENIDTLKKSFETINKILLPFDNTERAIPGFVFIPCKKLLTKFCNFYNRNFTLITANDMKAFSKFQKKYPNLCDSLPVIPPEYTNTKMNLLTQKKHVNLNLFSKYYCSFNYLFDAAALGQFIGGTDSRNSDNKDSTIGFVNTDAIYNISDFKFFWYENEGLFYPKVEFNGKIYPLLNLHIHSKNLHLYMSNRKD